MTILQWLSDFQREVFSTPKQKLQSFFENGRLTVAHLRERRWTDEMIENEIRINPRLGVNPCMLAYKQGMLEELENKRSVKMKGLTIEARVRQVFNEVFGDLFASQPTLDFPLSILTLEGEVLDELSEELDDEFSQSIDLNGENGQPSEIKTVQDIVNYYTMSIAADNANEQVTLERVRKCIHNVTGQRRFIADNDTLKSAGITKGTFSDLITALEEEFKIDLTELDELGSRMSMSLIGLKNGVQEAVILQSQDDDEDEDEDDDLESDSDLLMREDDDDEEFDERRIQVINSLARFRFEIRVDSNDDEDDSDDPVNKAARLAAGPIKPSLSIISGTKGGRWSDAFEFDQEDPRDYFEALEQAIASYIALNKNDDEDTNESESEG